MSQIGLKASCPKSWKALIGHVILVRLHIFSRPIKKRQRKFVKILNVKTKRKRHQNRECVLRIERASLKTYPSEKLSHYHAYIAGKMQNPGKNKFWKICSDPWTRFSLFV